MIVENNVESHLWELGKKEPEWKSALYAIDASYRILSKSLSMYSTSLDDKENFEAPILAYGYVKLIITESWTIHSIIHYILKKPTTNIDAHWKSLKIFRDALAHLDERIKGNMLVRRKIEQLKPEANSFAGGLVRTNDGKNWESSASLTFNFNFGEIGAITTLGMIDNYILTSTATGLEEMRINGEILDAIDKDIFELS